MLTDPSHKYHPFAAPALPGRQWPQRRLDQAPIWLSTDLRDGNQALARPMNAHQKRRFWDQLLACGFKEIEIAFPAASQTDFDFVRELIEQDAIPPDVTIAVITQSRPDLIERSFVALAGARRAIVHLYNATAPAWRRQVFATGRDGVRELAERGTRQIRALAHAHPETEWVFQYSPETFSATEPDFALDICDAVSAIWQPTPEHKMIVNLPATVEMSTPNAYADQIEWMHTRLARRDSLILSVHPHNDRGCAVAAAELAQLAGAERVEGCLFGNGERTGNVDLVTLALNLYTQGVSPGLDFSDLGAIKRLAEELTELPVHPRHPYAGERVHTAFSGSHQDAIRKGLAQRKADAPWDVPYLPIDPADIGYSYQAVIRVNSQSGKGGVGWIMETAHGLTLPGALEREFSQRVQAVAERDGTELDAATLLRVFRQHYLDGDATWDYLGHEQEIDGDRCRLSIRLRRDGREHCHNGHGNGPLDALVAALGLKLDIVDFRQHALAAGSRAPAIAYVQLRDRSGREAFGVAEDGNVERGAIRAVLAGAATLERLAGADAHRAAYA
jgi:2-isopropylmalate synthase